MMIAELIFCVIFQTITAIILGGIISAKSPFIVRIRFPILHTRQAKKMTIPSFATSAGCRENPKTLIHLVAPWDVIPSGVFTSKIRIADTI